MLDVFNTATPTNGNVQYFYKDSSWTKPRGVSHVYMMLIGGGGRGNTSTGGAPGAITVWYGAAQHVPDDLIITVSPGNSSGVTTNTSISFNSSSGQSELLNAGTANTSTGGAAMTANAFTPLGFFQSTAGVYSTSLPTDSFLSTGNIATTHYGYRATNGFFATTPIIAGGGGSVSASGGIGCGGGVNSTKGGPGLVVIAAW